MPRKTAFSKGYYIDEEDTGQTYVVQCTCILVVVLLAFRPLCGKFFWISIYSLADVVVAQDASRQQHQT